MSPRLGPADLDRVAARLKRLLFRTFLSLPSPILRLLAGGGVTYLDGRTLDPRLQYLDALAKNRPLLSSMTAQQARALGEELAQLLGGEPEPGVTIEAVTIDGPGGPIPARAYRPPEPDRTAPLLVFAHEGGGVLGDLDTCHAFCSLLAGVALCPVLSVGYRLAPEHRFPAGLDDMRAAFDWALQNAGRFGAPDGVAAIGGGSVGAGFAASITQERRRDGATQPAFQLLIYPSLDITGRGADFTDYPTGYPVSREAVDWARGFYVDPQEDMGDLRLSPFSATDLTGLAPAIVVTAGFDPLAPQAEDYARRLIAAGVACDYRRYDTLSHAFVAYTGAVPAADAACREVARLVQGLLERQEIQGGR